MNAKIVPAPRTSVRSQLIRPLVAGLAATTGGSLSAAIIHDNTVTGGSNGVFSITPLTGHDFNLSVSSGTMPTLKPVSSPGTPSSAVVYAGNASDAITSGSQSFGTTIDGSDTFVSGVSVAPDPGRNYLGFSMLDGSTTLYGWMDITYNSGNGTGSAFFNEWAYDDTGAGIEVGAIPEPASTGAVTAVAALLAGSAVVWKRRRNKLASAVAA